MFIFVLVILFITDIHQTLADRENSIAIEHYQRMIENGLKNVESDLNQFNSISALLTWELSTRPDDKKAIQAMKVGAVRNQWKNRVCESKVQYNWLTYEQKRKLYLFCRGPKFSNDNAMLYLKVLGKMEEIFNSEICSPDNQSEPLHSLSYPNQNTTNYPLPGQCIHGEPDLERLMKRSDLNVDQLKWTWKTWHNFVGPPIKKIYPYAIRLENDAAKNKGYRDMGQIWKDELEIPDLENEAFKLYQDIKSLYVMLHAVVRHKLLLKYGSLEVDPLGPIPIHLLGNMWGQDWSSLINLFVSPDEVVNLEEKLHNKNWTVKDMVLQAEDMYMSLGLPKMTNKFWKYSIFEESGNTSICHGTAANMYSESDYRILMCAKVDMENFYIIHHEMGHIQYFMAYQNKSPIFQDGANSAIHESIGDAIMNGVISPQHLHRLKLLNDEELSNKSTDQYLLLKEALRKIPEIPYSLIVDKYRWDIFSGKITVEDYNKIYWELNKSIRGIVPPEKRGEEFFDAASKFHIPDNTPYIRYFLSSIIQIQIYKGLCELSIYGRHPETVKYKDMKLMLPLHRCDIYGSKKCGKYLLHMMQQGSSINWSEALQILTGKNYISTKPLMEYYSPIYEWLKTYINMYNVPVGW